MSTYNAIKLSQVALDSLLSTNSDSGTYITSHRYHNLTVSLKNPCQWHNPAHTNLLGTRLRCHHRKQSLHTCFEQKPPMSTMREGCSLVAPLPRRPDRHACFPQSSQFIDARKLVAYSLNLHGGRFGCREVGKEGGGMACFCVASEDIRNS